MKSNQLRRGKVERGIKGFFAPCRCLKEVYRSKEYGTVGYGMEKSIKNRYTITLDDDPMVCRVIEKSLGIKSLPFFSLGELLTEIDKYRPMATFVDIHLDTSANGLEIIPHLRTHWPYCPIIVITGDLAEEAVSEALASGADDFVRKPIQPKELVARVQARIGDLTQKEAKAVIRIGDVTLDTVHRVLRGNHREIYVSPTAVSVLSTLIQANGTVLSRDVLKRRAWGKLRVSDNALDRKIFEVRQALREITELVEIVTDYGKGFALERKERTKTEPKIADSDHGKG
jgi:DNA-binding response OmpR family regulator